MLEKTLRVKPITCLLVYLFTCLLVYLSTEKLLNSNLNASAISKSYDVKTLLRSIHAHTIEVVTLNDIAVSILLYIGNTSSTSTEVNLSSINNTETVEVNENCRKAQHILILNNVAADREGDGGSISLTLNNFLFVCE